MDRRWPNSVRAIVLLGLASGCGGPGSSDAQGDSGAGIPTPAPTCYGTPLLCSARSAFECTSTSGCLQTTTCTGVVTPCTLRFAQFECTSQEGCSWDSSQSQCVGIAEDCGLISPAVCSTQDGCQQGMGCDGVPQPCGSYSQVECDSQSGCIWGVPPPDTTSDASPSDGPGQDASVDGTLDAMDSGVAESNTGCSKNGDCAASQDPNLCNARLTCQGGVCLPDPSTAVSCDPANDTACKKNTCSPSTGQCSMADQPDGTFCDDGLYCTTLDSCSLGVCVGSGSPCTSSCETCNEAAMSCVVAAGQCEIQFTCYSAGAVSLSNPCEDCQPGASQTAWSPVARGVACSINDTCQVSTVCDGAGTCSGAAVVPPVPVLWAPRAGSLTGSLVAPSSAGHLRPTFTWHERADGCATLPTFDVQVDDTCPSTGFQACTFPSPEASGTGVTLAQFQPSSDLPVSSVVPVGRRYYWRVRACRGASCSAWSTVSYLDVGRARIDVNGDGYSDLFATQLDGYGDLGEGTVYAYLGSPTGVRTTPDITLQAPLPGQKQYFGRVLRTGDLNADGFADLVVAAPSAYEASTTSNGVVYVYYGGPSGPAISPDATLVSPTATATTFGHAFAAAGDVDADGFADLVAEGAVVAVTDPLAVVYTGAASGIDVASFAYPLLGAATQKWATAIATDGDLNGDTIADIVIAGSFAWEYEGAAGGAFAAPTSPNPDINNFDWWPEVLCTAADLDRNGYADLLYDGQYLHNSILDKGVFEFYSLGYPPTNYTTIATNPRSDNQDIFASFTTGDFDGTGPVVALASVGAYSILSSIGYVYLYRAFASAPFASFTSPVPATGQTFGMGVQNVGDLNGDSYDDLAIGEPYGGNAYAGNAYVLYGSATGLPAIPSATLVSPRSGQSAYENFGVTFGQ